MKLKTISCIIALSLTLALTACDQRSPHEREIQRIEKETRRINRSLARMKKRNPEIYVETGNLEKETIEEALRVRDWEKAKRIYKLLLSKDIDLLAYSEELETRVLEIVSPLPRVKYEENYLGYDFLVVINPDDQTYAEKAITYKTLWIESVQGAIAKLKRSYDKVEGVYWYHHPSESNEGVYFYIGQRKGRAPYLRLKGQYTSEYGWLFVRQVTAWFDGENKPLLIGSFDRRNTSRVWEWKDISPTEEQVNTMRALANADESIVRFEGKDRDYDLTLTARDKRAIVETLEAYRGLIVVSQE